MDKTQEKIIRNWLESHGSITPKEAEDICGTMRLSAHIWNLRHKSGLDIETVNCTKRNDLGNITNYAKYVLKKKEE